MLVRVIILGNAMDGNTFHFVLGVTDLGNAWSATVDCSDFY